MGGTDQNNQSTLRASLMRKGNMWTVRYFELAMDQTITNYHVLWMRLRKK